MKQCPICTCPLRAESYEEARVFRCAQCKGVYLPEHRLEWIRHRRGRDHEALKAEARDEFRADMRKAIRCPACRGPMDKRPIASRYTTLAMDVCKSCDGIWLDGGELAMAQLIFEASTRGQESQEFQSRMQALEADPVRRRQFEEAMARLPEELPIRPEDIAGDLVEDLLWQLIRGRPTSQL